MVKKSYLRKGKLILGNGKKLYVKSGRLILGNGKTQKGKFLPVAAALAPLVPPLVEKLFGRVKKQHLKGVVNKNLVGHQKYHTNRKKTIKKQKKVPARDWITMIKRATPR